jgi:hypothetical protein
MVFILDLYHGRPFYTPNVLGAILFRSATISDLSTLPISLKMILYYTWFTGWCFV